MKAYLDILRLVWPLALGMVNNAVMQFVDRAYLANESMASLEAILPATTLAWVFLGFFQSIVGYSGVFVAQYHGVGDAVGCVRSYRAGQWMAGLSALLLLPLIPIGDWVFGCTAATPQIAAMEASYYDIVLLGAFFLMGQMAATAYFTGRSRTRIVFWVNLAGNVVNIALDPILIFGWFGCPKLGIAGAAVATVASQAVQFAVLAFAAHGDVREAGSAAGRSSAEDMKTLFLRILRFGMPAGGYEIFNMASFTIFVFVTGQMDEISFAASNACFTINYLLYAPMMGFALGAQTLVGQARGRGDNAAAQVALARTLRLALGFALVVVVLTLALQRPILALFAPPEIGANGAFHAMGLKLLVLMSAWILFDAADVVIAGALKGAGDTRFVFWWMLAASFAIWMPLVGVAYCLHATMPVLWLTVVIDVVVIMTGSWWRWHRGAWRHIDLVSPTGHISSN